VLLLHRADRADRLVDVLARTVSAPLEDLFAAEVVAVPTRGVERWVAQRLADGAGVCANVAFPSPRRLVDETVAAASGFDADQDPWLPARMVWPLLEVIDGALGEPWLAGLAAHLDTARGDRSRRFRLARHLADLYDRYALYRPELIEGWLVRSGEEDRWQAELWRRLRAHVGVASPVERLGSACARLVADPGLSPLPARLSLFGLTSLPERQLEVLRALADGRDVHLFLLQPSDASWRHVAEQLERHTPDPAALLPANPLLASWGRDARELQMTLARAQPWASDTHHAAPAAPPATLLQRVQADVRGDRAPEPSAEARADPSLQIHACHGAHRQVEVLRDAIKHALQDDPTLEPRDVIVMCPDIETFAPLIQATFGTGEEPGDDELRVRLADRALRETNPVLGVVARLLELTTARATASEILDLADREPVRRRFRFGQDDTSRLEDWVAASGTRWGFAAAARTDTYNLPDFPQGTWATGIDRLLAGVALAEDEPRLLANSVVPLDDVDSSAIDLAGRFAEFVERLGGTIDAFRDPKTIAEWTSALATAADALTATSAQDAWQRAELQRLLADVLDEATGDDDDSTPATAIDAADLSALLERRLAGRPTRASFRTGHLTVCTLQPMRSVPHRVVCLLGLDDTVFPRRAPRDGDDLLIAAPFVGDRDARSEDRQILLDALLAAQDRLIVTYTGNDERTNAERAPAVPVAELLDVIERTAGQDVRQAVVIRHPLQTFDARNFLRPAPWSFDTTTLAGARALVAERPSAPGFLPEGRLPELRGEVVELEDLIAFLGRPVHAFLRQRLGISFTTLPSEHLDGVEDELPIDLDHLTRWRVGNRLLTALLQGADFTLAQEAERLRGALAPGAIGLEELRNLSHQAQMIADAARRTAGEPRVVDVSVAIDGGRRLAGTVSGLRGDVLQEVTFARIGAGHRLGAWARLLALTAAHPDRPFSAITVGRPRIGASPRSALTRATIPPLLDGAPPAERRAAAEARLTTLVELYDNGMREPLPLYGETSAAFAAQADLTSRRRALAAAEQRWATPFGAPAPFEDRDADHERVLGRGTEFQDLLSDTPRDDERWHPDERTRFGQYAHRLWTDLLAVEDLRDAQ
jgi:exodeoxyribonuclease V gamma subunit